MSGGEGEVERVGRDSKGSAKERERERHEELVRIPGILERILQLSAIRNFFERCTK